jgi:predicted DsbA family dithiol-disulfide isomerase
MTQYASDIYANELNQGQAVPVPGSTMSAPGGIPAGAGALMHITYYTDPLCSWSWAFEPQWRRLRQECGSQLTWRYHMAGMISDWQQYSDPLNDVSRPVQMGPQWYQVRAASGMPLEERIWYEDPPASSYPGCVAVMAAQMQGSEAGERYLRLLREAVMLKRRNIARRDVHLAVAEELNSAYPSFDLDRFASDLQGPEVLGSFRESIKDARYHNINRFPTLIVRPAVGRAAILVGYRPYGALQSVLTTLVPSLSFVPATGGAAAFVHTWGSATAQEVAESVGIGRQEAEASLQALVDAGQAVRQGELFVAVE